MAGTPKESTKRPGGRPPTVKSPRVARSGQGLPASPENKSEELLTAQLPDRTDDVRDARTPTRALLAATQSIVGDPSRDQDGPTLEAVVRRTVDAAQMLVGARSAAFGVVTPDGSLDMVTSSSVEQAATTSIVTLLREYGIDGGLAREPGTIRLGEPTVGTVSTPPPSVPPPDRPRAVLLLGVPVVVRDKVFGRIFLAGKADGSGFTTTDEGLVATLASTAGMAIDNARLLREATHRTRWLQHSTNVTLFLLGDGDDPFGTIAHHAMELSGAHGAAVLVVRESGAAVVTGGAGNAVPVLGTVVPERSSVGPAIQEGAPLAVADASRDRNLHYPNGLDVGPVLVVPMKVTSDSRGGVLVLNRSRGSEPFSDEDLALATGFTGQVALAQEMIELNVLVDRQHIARDLHDHVIQRLYAVGLGLDGTATKTPDSGLRRRLSSYTRALDDTIGDIRSSIFRLRTRGSLFGVGLRDRVLDVVYDLRDAFPEPPVVRIDGPVDSLVDPTFQDAVVAVVREGLTNAARHSRARNVEVVVEAGINITVEVVDNGCGIEDGGQRSGLENLRLRAEEAGGRLTVGRRQSGGTWLRWEVPARAAAAARSVPR